jgi:retron-type reverse transcriptase
MYFHPRRRGGHLAGARARQVPVGAHVGTAAEFLRRHGREAIAAARGGSATRKQFLAGLLDRTADSRNLRTAWDYLARHGGQAPGPDGLHYDDLDGREIWDLLRTLRRAILDDTYRPGPDRRVHVPKTSGKGTRTLLLSSVTDRVVQRAIVQTVQPYLDPQFDDDSFGYRPGRDRQHALARAEWLATSSNLWVWVAEDIRNAFDQVPQCRLLDVVRLRLPDEGIVRLIERVVLTDTGRGLRQGGCLSPLHLNLYLDHFLDGQWRKRHGHPPLVRVADDLLVVTRTEEEAHQARDDLRTTLLPAAMPLKGSPSSAVRDLANGNHADWLGYRVNRGKYGLEVRLADRSWTSLRHQLELAHTEPEPPLRAGMVITGWVDQLGPCYPWTDRQDVYARVARTARELAFDEIPTWEEFLHRWREAYGRWTRIQAGGA